MKTVSTAVGNINPLADFLQNSKEHIVRLKETRQPEVLTVGGKAEIVVQDAAGYRELLSRVERAELLQSLRKARNEVAEGKFTTLADLKKELDERFAV